MSNAVRQLIELTVVKPMPRKAVLLHIADTVRDGDLLYFRSIAETARRLSTGEDVIRRHIAALERDGILIHVGERIVNGGPVKEYRVNLSAILARPTFRPQDDRLEYVVKAAGGGGVQNTGGEVFSNGGGGVEKDPIQREPYLAKESAEKKERHLKVVHSAKDDPRLAADPGYRAFVAEMEAKAAKRSREAGDA